MKKLLVFIFAVGAIAASLAWLVSQQTGITMINATVETSPDVQRLVKDALEHTNVSGAKFFIITNVDEKPDGKVNVSVAGANEITSDWTLENATWTGTVVLDKANHVGRVQEAGAQTEYGMGYGGAGYILPFASGTTAYYGTLGVHNCGYALDGWKAVDLFPADNLVYASVGGTINYVCRDSTQVAIRIGNNMYTHLVDTGQQVGDYYDQGQSLGALVKGKFTATCGYADQQPENYHLHFCFIPDAGKFLADGYSLDTGTHTWTKGDTTVDPGGTLVADWQNADDTWIPSTQGGMFNIWDWLLNGLISITWWIATKFFLPPGTGKATVFGLLNWSKFFGSGVMTVLMLTGAALSVFNWWIPAIAFFIDMVLFLIQLGITIWQFVLGLLKKIPFL